MYVFRGKLLESYQAIFENSTGLMHGGWQVTALLAKHSICGLGTWTSLCAWTPVVLRGDHRASEGRGFAVSGTETKYYRPIYICGACVSL